MIKETSGIRILEEKVNVKWYVFKVPQYIIESVLVEQILEPQHVISNNVAF